MAGVSLSARPLRRQAALRSMLTSSSSVTRRLASTDSIMPRPRIIRPRAPAARRVAGRAVERRGEPHGPGRALHRGRLADAEGRCGAGGRTCCCGSENRCELPVFSPLRAVDGRSMRCCGRGRETSRPRRYAARTLAGVGLRESYGRTVDQRSARSLQVILRRAGRTAAPVAWQKTASESRRSPHLGRASGEPLRISRYLRAHRSVERAEAASPARASGRR